jgi:membrane-bound lytic murein transglycosylase D
MTRTSTGPFPIAIRVLSLLGLVLATAAAVHLLTFSVAGDPGNDPGHDFRSSYRIFPLTLPERMVFCDEPVPLDRIDVRERLDRELLVNTYWQSNTLLAHKRAARWFPVIEPILREEGVPDDMKYLPLIESGFTHVVSPKGASGYWQFMKETATQMGLEVNDEVDERYHVERSTRAACRFLKAAHAQFGSWTMAVAAYNLGNAGLERRANAQGTRLYYDLLLPDETMRYVFRLLAMKEIIADPERYGYHLRRKDLYAPYAIRTVTVDGPVADLAAFARTHGTDYKTLKLLNPWLRDTKLGNAQRRAYTIALPAEGFHALPRP